MKEWTPEQIRNAEIYGICWICGAPREMRVTEETMEDGRLLVNRFLICSKEPIEHQQ